MKIVKCSHSHREHKELQQFTVIIQDRRKELPTSPKVITIHQHQNSTQTNQLCMELQLCYVSQDLNSFSSEPSFYFLTHMVQRIIQDFEGFIPFESP